LQQSHNCCSYHRQPCKIELILKPDRLEIIHYLEKSSPQFKEKFGFIERIEEILTIERRGKCLGEKNP